MNEQEKSNKTRKEHFIEPMHRNKPNIAYLLEKNTQDIILHFI